MFVFVLYAVGSRSGGPHVDARIKLLDAVFNLCPAGPRRSIRRLRCSPDLTDLSSRTNVSSYIDSPFPTVESVAVVVVRHRGRTHQSSRSP